MSKHSCCAILVWVLLQLIYLSPILMNCVRSRDRIKNYREIYPDREIYFNQNLQYELSQKSVDGINEWKSSDFDRQCVTKRKPFSSSSLRNIVGTMELIVQKERLILNLSNETFQNVSDREKSIDKFKTAFSFRKTRKYTVALNNILAICSHKLINISKCSNLLAEQVSKEGSKLICILRNRNSRFSVAVQLFRMVDDDDSYSCIFELRHKPISNRQNTANFNLWIPNCDFTSGYIAGCVLNFSFKGLWKGNVNIFDDNGFSASLFRMSTVLSSHSINCCNCNVSNWHFEHKRNSLKENSKAPNENSFITKENSRKNRFLLSVNYDSNLDEEKRDINTSQNARRARNKKVQSMNNQSDSPTGNRYATKVERRRKRKSHRLAKDLTFAAKAKRAISSSQEAEATKRAAWISFSPDNEADYLREIDRQIEADFVKIKDTLRLEKVDAISSEIPRWPLNLAKNNRQSVNQPTIDTQEPEIITGKRVCIAPHCQQVIQQGLRAKSPDSNELPANSRGNVASEQNGIAATAAAAVAPRKVVDEKIRNEGNDDRKLVGEALIILNKHASPLTIVEKSNGSDMNLKYSVESISLGLDELVKMGKEAMKKELDNNAVQNETREPGLSRKNCLKYAKGNNETYRGLEDDEGTKLEEQLKELRALHIQRQQGFTNSGKSQMRFAAADEYTFRNDEDARINNEYSPAHVRHGKKRCRRKKYKSVKSSNPIQNKIEKFSENLSNDVPLSDALVNGVTKTPSRIKKNNPYRVYSKSGAEEKSLADRKAEVYARNKIKALQEMHSLSKSKKVRDREKQTVKDSLVKFRKSSDEYIESNIPHKSVNVRSHKIIKKNMLNRQSSSMSRSKSNPQSSIKKKNRLSQSVSNRKLKSVGVGRILRETFAPSESDTLLRDISNYYDDDDLEIPTDNSLDEAIENRNTRTNAPRRKLLSSNSMEYDEGSSISANEESNYDYVEKFYGDQPYEKGPPQLHYFQINLRNVTLLENPRMEVEASRIELAQCHANKSMKTTSANHKTISKIGYPKRTLKSFAQEENSDYQDEKDSVKNLYLSGDLIGYNYDPEESDSQEKFKREIDENEDPDLARLFSNGQEYDINVRGKLHLRLKDPDSIVAGEESSKKKRSARPKIEKSRKKLPQIERKFAVPDKRTKRNPDKDSADVHKEDGNLKSKVSNKMRKPLKKISDFFKRKFAGGAKKKEFRKKIHAKAKIVRVKKPGQDEDNSQSTFPPYYDQSTTTLESRSGNCKCAHETSTTLASEFTSMATDTFETTDYNAQSTKSNESITESNDPNYAVYSKICHCRDRSTEKSSIITHATQQYVTNQPETNCPKTSTKAQLSHEIVSEESPETITTTGVISTNGQTEKPTIIPSNPESSENSPEQKAKMKNVMEILNFIKNLEKLLKDQKAPLRIGDENGGVEIKLEKIYMRPGKNQSIVELKDVSEADQKEDISDLGDTSEVIRQSDAERPIVSTQIESVQSLSNQNSKYSSNAAVQSDLNENIFDETSQTIEKPKKYDSAILETYIEASVPKSSRTDKNASNNKSIPAKQWIDEQRIASDDQSSSRGRGSTSSDRKKQKRRRKKRRRRLRKRTVNKTSITSQKGKAPNRLRRRRRRRPSIT